jgi:hypothetical protein
MTWIRVSVTRDVTDPPNRNLIPRFTKEGEHKKMRNDALVMEIRGYRIVEKGIFTVSLADFPSGHG